MARFALGGNRPGRFRSGAARARDPHARPPRLEPPFEPAFDIADPDAVGPWVVTCDHAANAVPGWLGATLGLPPEDMARHIAYDLGAAGLSRALARRLGAPAILARFSRLVIDPNRGEDDPTLVMKLYDGSIVPGNRHADAGEIERRLDRLHRPYHAALGSLLAARPGAAMLAIHSFTPRLQGRAPRPWEVAVLHSHRDGRLALPLLRRLRGLGLCVGDNEPYSGHLPGDSVDRHALGAGRLNALIEVRQDLISTPRRRRPGPRA
jgi:predicted N-formylglutamate amidohydrolase